MRSNRIEITLNVAYPSSSIRIIILMVYCVMAAFLCSSCSRQPHYPAPPMIGPNVAVDIAMLREEVPVFFTYEYQNRPVSFFIVRINGRISSFLDACVSCYMRKRGYGYDNGRVTCRSCGMKFSLSQLEKGVGGCYPIKIAGRTENGKFLIPVAMLEASTDKF